MSDIPCEAEAGDHKQNEEQDQRQGELRGVPGVPLQGEDGPGQEGEPGHLHGPLAGPQREQPGDGAPAAAGQVGGVGLGQVLGPCGGYLQPVESIQPSPLVYRPQYQGQAVKDERQEPAAFQGRPGRQGQGRGVAVAAPGLQVDRGRLAAHVVDEHQLRGGGHADRVVAHQIEHPAAQ